MNTATITRKQTSFRLREDLLKVLKIRAKRVNRTLNNYVESLLLEAACEDEDEPMPNAETLEAMSEAEAGGGYRLDTSSFEAMQATLFGEEATDHERG